MVRCVEEPILEEGWFNEVTPVRGVGKQQLLPNIAASLPDLPVLLCGSPGSGKKNLLKSVADDADVQLNIFDISEICVDIRTSGGKQMDIMGTKLRHDLLEKVIRQFSGQERSLDTKKKTLLALYGAEHLDEKGTALARKSKIVLIASERTKPLKNAFGDRRTIWVNRLTHTEMTQSLQTLHPTATPDQIKRATQLANGDLRKAQIHINSRSNYTDNSKHVYFDVQDALCKGVRKELDYHSRQWLSENHLQVGRSIEEHAAFSDNMVIAAIIEDPDWEHAAPNCIGNTADVVTGMAVKRLVGYKRTKLTLQHPPVAVDKVRKRMFPKCREELAIHFIQDCTSALTTPMVASTDETQNNSLSATTVDAGADRKKRKRSHQPAEVNHQSSSSHRVETVILDFKQYCVRSATPFASTTDGELTTMTCGPILQCNRNRTEVIVECPGASDDVRVVYNELKQQGVTGITVSKFRNGVAALIVKDKNKDLKFGGVTKALEPGRRSNDTVIAQARLFSTAVQSYSDMVLEEKKVDNKVDNEMPDFAEACEELSAIDSAGFRELHANAIKAKKYKRMTPIQDAILAYTGDLKEWLACKEDAESMVFHMGNPGPHFLDNFKRSMVLNLRGLHYEMNSGIMTTTLKDAISRPQAPGKPPLCYAKTMIFVGKPSTGKSELVHGLCREFCQRHGKDKYAMSGSIDPYGLMTKSGKMKELGALGLYDFEMKSKINSRISCEEAKGLLYVKERAHLGARYHQCVMYEFVPRFWAINMGHDHRGEDDPSEWFRREHLEGLAKLVQEDDEGLKTGSGHDQAIARRAVIFVVDECLFESDAQGATDALAVARWEEGMANATPLD